LINDLTNLSAHLVLALDDYHTITSQEVHRAIHYFINHAPEFFHLLIVSRVEPPLPLTR
jgi:LuxR family transcriptional regulator, maltose regulon positive regulatory protein